MDSLFGGEITGAARFVIAFVVVLLLIGILAWLVRRFGSGALTSSGGRGRQPRLAVIDAATVDARRRLILVRRDNVEHLLMIGGPSDVVIESNIVRAAATSREAPAPRSVAAPEAMPRAVSLDEGTQWPLQPQPEPVRAQRDAASVTAQWGTPVPPIAEPPTAEPPLRAQRTDTLADLADALAAHPSREPASRDVVREAAAPSAMRQPDAVAEPQYATPESDQNLAEMAQRLQAAHRSAAEPHADIAASVALPHPHEPALDMPQPATAEPPLPEVPVPTVRPELAAPRPGQSKNFYENLEQEMASLLGRPTGKT